MTLEVVKFMRDGVDRRHERVCENSKEKKTITQ